MRRSTVAAAVGVTALALTGCAGGGGEGSGGGAVDNATIAIAADPGSLNPITNATQAGQEVSAYLYETLMSFAHGKDAEGLLAESWTESTTEVSFVLKEGILCADGAELTASDVKASFDYAADPETASPYSGVYFPAEGLTVEADDSSRTVTFTSEQPQSFLLSNIGQMPVVCAAGVDDPASLDATPVGTGIYTLEDSSPGQTYTLALRDDYTWGPGDVTSDTAGLPKTVTLEVVDTEPTRANMLLSSEVNVAEVGGTDRDRLETGELFTIDVPARPGLMFFNQAEGRPTNDLLVREGIAGGIDREEVASVSTGGRGELMTSLVSSFTAVCAGADATTSLIGFDADAAAATLDEAGWTVGSDGVREKDGAKLALTFVYPSTEAQSVVAGIELIQQQLAEIGVDVTPSPSSSYTDVIFQGGDWDLIWAPISTTLPSTWAGILAGDFPPNGGNWTYNTNQEFFDLTAEAQQLAGEESCDAWTAAQASAIGNLEVMPFAESTSTLYGAGVEFEVTTNGLLIPTSLRG
ncbi:ABC transporter substrate-binding protein [Microbacterium paraoxydans]|uniref:ABC transporter substrate-binding protein n=1 Tax=Microbacterium paraoxydans TaxID=199592 RepID=UPI001CFA280F|nr:ABC transporter substrate-binding protein [Microbacterium paraoxydans]